MVWDGEERRNVNWNELVNSLHSLDIKITRVESHLLSELGGDGTTGNINYGLNEIRANVLEVKNILKTQNGRISKLENWRSGVVACLGLLVILIGWFLKK